MTLVNDTNDMATFDLWLVDDGSSFEDLAEHISRQQSRLDRGRPTLGPPSFAHKLSSTSVRRRESAGFAATVEVGLYGFVCSRLKKSDLVGVSAAGPVEVTEVTSAG